LKQKPLKCIELKRLFINQSIEAYINKHKIGVGMLKTMVLFSLFVLALSACNSDNQSHGKYEKGPEMPVATPENESQQAKPMIITGTVIYNDFEGGFYGFIAKDGGQYTLRGLPKQHQKDGLVIKISANEITGILTTTQFGAVLQVNDIEVIDDSNVNPKKEAKDI
jgi:hypothetical protein